MNCALMYAVLMFVRYWYILVDWICANCESYLVDELSAVAEDWLELGDVVHNCEQLGLLEVHGEVFGR